MPLPSTRGIVVVTGFKAYRLDCRIPFVRGLHLDLPHLTKLVKIKKSSFVRFIRIRQITILSFWLHIMRLHKIGQNKFKFIYKIYKNKTNNDFIILITYYKVATADL